VISLDVTYLISRQCLCSDSYLSKCQNDIIIYEKNLSVLTSSKAEVTRHLSFVCPQSLTHCRLVPVNYTTCQHINLFNTRFNGLLKIVMNEWMNEKKIYIARLKAYKCMINLPRLAENWKLKRNWWAKVTMSGQCLICQVNVQSDVTVWCGCFFRCIVVCSHRAFISSI